MINVQVDASYRQATSEGGIGIFLKYGQEQLKLKYYLSKVYDNHWLEFLALKLALEYILGQEDQDQLIRVFTDSKIVVKSLEKSYVKKAEYKSLLADLQGLIGKYPSLFISWIPDKDNGAADTLARQALNQQGKFISLL